MSLEKGSRAQGEAHGVSRGQVSRTGENIMRKGQPQCTSTQPPQSKQPHRVGKPTALRVKNSSPMTLDSRTRILRTMKDKGYPNVKKKRKRKRKKVEGVDFDKENLVISIHRKSELIRVVMMKEAPYLCAQCGLTFTRSAALKEHAETEHSYVEPTEGADDKIMPLVSNCFGI